MLDGKQVLIVEDDPVTAVVLQGMLRKLGAVAVVRDDAACAWKALCAQPFDLVFLDLCLGESDGETLLRQLRATGASGAPDPRTPVVVITGRADLDSRVRLLDSGADQFVMKPFDLRELEALVRAVFRRRSANGRLGDRAELELDAPGRSCVFRGRRVVLTRAEFDILLCLVRSYPQAVPAAGLLKEANDAPQRSTALQVHIHHLRQKLHEDAIETVGGVGYRLADGQVADPTLQLAA
ncbi:response regulator transcription factor [Ramlibacter monticola]|uniref:Response regulator transcription factor n=1 Tax=Ramlibacter monticola TaxID=1926872 RepID=A0A937CVB3_9BURK|nr:response regulator transcription factor [Ramlibacter monticola]MBL0393559.1 response regulator transcription factor [Ramlibacter monticola]